MGSDAAGEKIKDHVKQLAPLLQDKSIVPNDKIRLILLYIIQKGGNVEYFFDSQHDANLYISSKPWFYIPLLSFVSYYMILFSLNLF